MADAVPNLPLLAEAGLEVVSGEHAGVAGGAVFSHAQGQLYRHLLWRLWDETLPFMAWVMLNPSKAGAPPQDDATVRRCTGFARGWGYGGYYVVNLSDLVATDPRAMLKLPYQGLKVGGHLGVHRQVVADHATKLVVCAWGDNAAKSNGLGRRARDILTTIEDAGHIPHYLTLTKHDHPGHPLRLPKTLQPQPWTKQGFVY